MSMAILLALQGATLLLAGLYWRAGSELSRELAEARAEQLRLGLALERAEARLARIEAADPRHVATMAAALEFLALCGLPGGATHVVRDAEA